MGVAMMKPGSKAAGIPACVAAALAVCVVAVAIAAALLRGAPDEEPTPAQVAALAAQVRPGEVTMYVADGCLYCDLASKWLVQRSFVYTACNISSSAACARAFKAHGARGTPFLVVRGEQMREGFQPGLFLKILRQRPG